MEKKKLLLVAVSVGIFLVIVIGASILVFSPRNTGAGVVSTGTPPIPAGSLTAAAASNPAQDIWLTDPALTGPASVDPADMVRNSDGLQGLQTPPVSATASQETNFYIYGDTQSQTVTRDSTTNLIIDVPRPTVAAVPDIEEKTPEKKTPVVQTTTTAPAPTPAPKTQTSSGKTTTSASTTTTTSAPKPVATTVSAAKPASQTYDSYWVQAGSYSTLVRADGVKETLSAKGITSIIENRDIDGKTYFRVRVGPYTSQTEATYWLALVKSISGFEDSQVWKTQSLR